MKTCLRCGAKARWLGDMPGRLWWICEGECGFEWDNGIDGGETMLEYCPYNGMNSWKFVPAGCLGVFSSEEVL